MGESRTIDFQAIQKVESFGIGPSGMKSTTS
jgi:hypothetical protein